MMMLGNVLSHNKSHIDPPAEPSKPKRSTRQAQEVVYNSLLSIVKEWPAEEVLIEFKHLFIYHVNSFSSDVFSALYEIIFTNNEEEFIHTLKRSCYILVNNWATNRNHKAIQELVELFSESILHQRTQSPTLKRLRRWINNFVNSKDFQELKLFTGKYDDNFNKAKQDWKQRYTSFLLAPQYADLDNPFEQREAARALARQLKDRFKFELAMYITRSQSTSVKGTPLSHKASSINSLKNPTALGDEALRLIKIILAKRGRFSHANLANIFIKQTSGLNYEYFKSSLLEYLIFSIENKKFIEAFRENLNEKLADLYEHHHGEVLTDALILRTCNRLVDYLLTEDQQEPSNLFVLLLSQSNPFVLVSVLLKIILISKHTRPHLEARIAKLIQYYGNLPEKDCQWVIHFLEVLNVTFAIYAENVEYNLIKRQRLNESDIQAVPEIDNYLVFSHQKGARKPKPDPEAFSLDDISMTTLDALPGKE